MTHLLVGSSSIFRCRRTDSFREGKWLFFSKQNGAPSKTSRHFSISNYSQSESRMKTTYMKLHDPLKHLNDSRPIFLILKLTGLTDQGQNSTGFHCRYGHYNGRPSKHEWEFPLRQVPGELPGVSVEDLKSENQ